MRGHLGLVASQLVYVKADRSIYFPVFLSQFEGNVGMYDAASGERSTDSTAEVPPRAVAPAAPLAAFGFRIEKFVQRSSPTQDIANQNVVGRIAFEFVERSGTQGIAANEVGEVMRFVIDRVQLTSDQNGEIVSARVLDGAQMHLYGRSNANSEVRESFSVPADTVRLLPMWQVLDHEGDNTSVVLLVELERAFSQAGQRLVAFENMRGHFDINVTMTMSQLVRPATTGSNAVEYRDLVGQPITVNSQPVVNGGGVSGKTWIRMYPPE